MLTRKTRPAKMQNRIADPAFLSLLNLLWIPPLLALMLAAKFFKFYLDVVTKFRLRLLPFLK